MPPQVVHSRYPSPFTTANQCRSMRGRSTKAMFVCVCVAFTEYERPPMTKSPIWSRLKLKQDAQVHLLYAFQFIYFPMQEGDWRRQPLISFSLKDSKRKKLLKLCRVDTSHSNGMAYASVANSGACWRSHGVEDLLLNSTTSCFVAGHSRS
ncbi:uncharacterized protein [Triticum aestivum]|uniref:uncharacterized protein isoform X12 n=1 Tax=Triticum aestivum TaxID=4565 RepID=UPI001D02C609|nr:uncharacterized protein LOC123119864 isoform X12 [Triticum aestivum]